jgi:RNA polymerase sigma-70 factor (ECF subfamily)
MNPDDEHKWVQEAQKDAQAFVRLYDRYFPRLYAYVSYRLTRVQDIEDLVAEAFLRAVREIKHFEWRHESSFAAWLFRIAHNLIVDFYRQNHQHDDPLPLENLMHLQALLPSPEEAIVQQETLAQLRQLINTLSSRQQEVITLKFLGQLRNQDIAEILGLDERTVASHLCRGLRELNQKYVDQFGQEEGKPNERTK